MVNLPERIVVCVVQLELDFLDEAGHVLVEERLDVDRPVVSVIVRFPFLGQKLGVASENDRFGQRNSANSNGLRRIEILTHFGKLFVQVLFNVFVFDRFKDFETKSTNEYLPQNVFVDFEWKTMNLGLGALAFVRIRFYYVEETFYFKIIC